MLTATYSVTIERHEWEDVPALTFQKNPSNGTSDKTNGLLVFALHGLTSRKERHLDLCLRLAEAGFRACSFDARSHGERRDEDSSVLSGNRQDPAFLQAFARTVIGTVQDIVGLASYFGASHYAIVGHSMGGFIAMQTAIYDARASAVVNISGSLSVGNSTSPDMPPDYTEMAARADVAARTNELVPRPILLLHGELDETVPIAGAYRLYNALKATYGAVSENARLIVYPEYGHDFQPAMAQDAVDWLKEVLVSKSK